MLITHKDCCNNESGNITFNLFNSLISVFKRWLISWSIKQFGTNCRFLQMTRIVAFLKWDELSLGTNCRPTAKIGVNALASLRPLLKFENGVFILPRCEAFSCTISELNKISISSFGCLNPKFGALGYPGLTLLLASWLSWQDLVKFLLHLGNHGSHGKILIKILLR